MGLVNKVRLVVDAFNNTQDKKKIIKKVLKAFAKGGITGLKHTVISVSRRENNNPCNIKDIYDYQQNLDLPTQEADKSITIIIEINSNNNDVNLTIDSLKRQIYKNYHIIVVAPKNYNIIEDYDIYHYNSYPGEVYQNIINKISDEYFIVINGGNVLHENALFLFAQKVEKAVNALVYCDECIFDGNLGKREKYFIKPDYSPIYQYSGLYMEQGIMFSSNVVRECSGLFEENKLFSARIHDAVLKVLRYSECILHISRILLLRNNSLEEIDIRQNVNILNRSITNLGVKGNVRHINNTYIYSIDYKVPKVSIIIPTDDIKLIHKCIKSIISKSDYPLYEIVVVSKKIICEKLEQRYKEIENITYVVYDDKYNYSRKCNLGAKSATGSILIFMQDSTLVNEENWIRNIVKCFSIVGIGAVSPKILRSDNTIRYAGIISGGFGFFPIPFNGESNVLIEGINEPAFFTREVSILSATCLTVTKDLFMTIGGYNEIETPDKFSNVDLSYKVQKQGLQCLYCAESIVHVDECNWYDSWFNESGTSYTSYLYILKNYTNNLENDPYFTNDMKYTMLRNVPIENAFFSGNSNDRSGKAVLLVSHELSLTGAPIALHYAAKSIRENGDYPVVVSPYDGKMRNELLNDGIDVIIDSTINGSDFWIKWASNFDLIIVSTLVQYHTINQLKNMNIPVIWWVHESRESYLLGANKLIPTEVGKNIHIYCGGGYAKKVMEEYRPAYHAEELLYCVPDYADISCNKYDYVLDDIQGKIVFSTIGTIEERKGQDIFSKAIMAMPKEYIEKCRFFIVGRKINDIVYDEVLRLKNSYPEQVTLINEVSRNEIRDVYNQCDAIVCASIDDPMPVFMTECLMLSKVAICSENTGTAALLQDGINGFVYKNNDYKELMMKMMYVIDNIHKLEEIKAKARETYERFFTNDAFDRNMTYIIDKLLNEEK